MLSLVVAHGVESTALLTTGYALLSHIPVELWSVTAETFVSC